MVFWYVTKLVSGGIRVSADEEIDGLDVGEHGNSAYPEFQVRSAASSPGAAVAHSIEPLGAPAKVGPAA